MMRLLLLVALIAMAHAGDAWLPIRGMSLERGGHSVTMLPDGRVLVAGGGAGGSYNATSEIFDPVRGTWTPTGSMLQARGSHTAVLLRSGKVLVIGGYYSDYLASCEVYDPSTGTWSATAAMPTARGGCTATPLPDGRLLVAGGFNGVTLASALIYDPASSTWSAPSTMARARSGHTATLLADGRVLVAGAASGAAAACEFFDPSTGTWSAAPTMISQRSSHTATLLPNGRVVVVGGFDQGTLATLGTCEEYDPATNLWVATGTLITARRTHGAALLASGSLLAIGGYTQYDCELYDPQTRVWSAAASLPSGAGAPSALLPTGQVLATGSACAVYQPASVSWLATGPLSAQRTSHAQLLLASGQVLAVSDSSAERYDPGSGTWSPTGAPPAASTSCPLVPLPDGKALLVGTQFLPRTACSIFDPDLGTWSPTGAMPVGVYEHQAVTLLSGRVLVAGGVSTGQCAVYDPVGGTWSATGSLATPRSGHSATLLADGRVLVAGGHLEGSGLTNVQASCEIYDPRTGAWSYTGSMITFRRHHTATLLPSGRVLVTGGWATSGVWSSCEVYDPASGEWSAVGSLTTGRYGHRATLAVNGTVVVSGGRTQTPFLQELASCEIYAPLSGTWSEGPSLGEKRADHAATLLPTGSILISGGSNNLHAGWPTTTSELLPMSAQGARQPVLTATTATGATIAVSGSGFTLAAGGGDPARSSAGPDNGRSSAANIPVLSWRRTDNERVWWLSPSGGFTAGHVDGVLPSDAAGPGWLRVHVNGTASAARFLQLEPPAASLASSALIISENGGVATLTATIDRAFALPVVVTLAVGGGTATAGDYALASTVLTIPAGSLDTTTTLTGIPDAIIEPGGETVAVAIVSVVNGVESGTQSATISITDYQTPGFTVGAISRHVTEGGQSAIFTVQPGSPPLSDVTLNLASTDSTEGVVGGGSSLIFTTGNWTTPQTVTVVGVDDAIADGAIPFQIIGSASSGDPDYNNRAMPAVAVVNDDDDVAGIAISAPVGSITEAGGIATVGISLTSQPTANVTLAIASTAPAQGTAGPASLAFTPANWNVPQTVTVTGADGDGVDNPTVGTAFAVTAAVTAGPVFDYPTSVTANHAVTCYPSNAAPTIAAIVVQNIDEDDAGTAVALAGISAGAGGEAQALTVTALSSDPAILPDPVVTYASPAATGSLLLAAAADATGTVTVTVRVTDDAGIGRAGAKDAALTTETSFQVTVAARNDAPVLAGTATALQAQAEDDAASGGTLIGAILGGLVVGDADAGALRGLAIVAAETDHGFWEYTTDGTLWHAVGATAPATARLLADDGVTRLRFVPAGDFTGTAGVTIRAWDRTAGSNGGQGDAGTTGGSSAFSDATATASVSVTPVNDAPVLAGGIGQALTAVVGGQANPGTPVAALIQGLITDVDGDPQGIAVIGVGGAGGGGSWQYSIDSGATWGDLSVASASAARLLSDVGSMLVRYAPQANESGTASLVFRAWDRTTGGAGGTAAIGATGGTAAFSALAATSTVAVSSGNAAPVVTLPTSLLSYGENQAPTPLDPAVTVGDADSANCDGGVLSIELIVGASADDRLQVVASGDVTVAGPAVSVDGVEVAALAGGIGPAPLTLAWNTAATPARMQAVLRAVCFGNVSDAPSTAVRIARVQTSDGDGGTSFPVTVTITVAALNDPPVIAASSPAGTWVEDDASLTVAPAVTVADPDSPVFASGTFSAALQSGGEASDALTIAAQGTGPGQIGVSGGEVSYGGVVFGTVSGGSGAATPLVVLLEASAGQEAVQALVRRVAFASTSQHPSTAQRIVRLRLADGNGGVSAAADVAVAVQAVNDPPAAAVSAWQVNPGNAYAVPMASLRFSDPDEPAAATLVATITAAPAAGYLKIGATGPALGVGGQFSMQDIADGQLVFVAPAEVGTVHAVFTLSDGAATTGPYDLAIVVDTVINELPDLYLTGDVAQWQESQPPVQIDPNATVSDADTPVFAGGEVSAAVTVNGGAADVLSLREVGGVTVTAGDVAVSGVVVGTVSGGSGGTPLRVVLNAAASVARVERVVRAISFAVDDSRPSIDPRTVQVQVSDGVSAGVAAQNAQVAVLAVNSAPVVACPRVAIAIAEDQGPVVLDDSATCIDDDSDDMAGGRLTVAFVSGGDGGDRLALAAIGDIAIAGDKVTFAGGEIGTWSGGGADPLIVELIAAASPDRVQALLRAVTVENVGQAPLAGTRVVRAMVEDGDGGSGSADIGVYVAAVNDPPLVTLDASAATWRQGDAPLALDAAATIADIDSPDFAGGRLTVGVTSGADATDRIVVVAGGHVALSGADVTWDGIAIGAWSGGEGAVPLVVSLNSDATSARTQDLLRAVAYRSTAVVPATQDRTLAVTVEDGDGGASVQRSRLFRVELVNLPPTVTLTGGAAAYTEDQAPVALDADAVVADPDSGDFAGGRLAVAGASADDRLTIADLGVGDIGLSGADVTWHGVVIGTWSGGIGADPLLVALNAAATPARVQDLLRAVRYANASQAPAATTTVSVVVGDGDGGVGTVATRTVVITPINDPPTAAPIVLAVAGQDASGMWTAADPEGDATLWTIVSQPANGVLALSDAATGAWSFTPASTGAATAVVRVADAHGASSPDLVVPVVVTGMDDARPALASDPPLTAQAGAVWEWELVVAPDDLADPPSLEIEPVGAPSGLGVVVSGVRGAVLSWAVPTDAVAGSHVRFLVRVSDRTTRRSSLVPVIIYLRAAISGGG